MRRRAGARASLVLVPLIALAAGCRRHPPPPAPAGTMPAWYPATLDADRYAGAAACRPCHDKEYRAWERSPHGRAMAQATPASVLGDFHGQEVAFSDGSIRFVRRGDAFFFESGGASHRVELTIGSGRQHQVYVTRDDRGVLRLLPAYWAPRTREWVTTRVQLGTSLDPASPRHWQRAEVVSQGNCFHCHLSQGRTRVEGGAVETRWVDLPINCEACHGPGRAHLEARQAGRPDAYGDLRTLGKEDEAMLCARCHAGQRLVWSAARAEVQYATLASRIFRADATQFGTPYQYAGHVSSECYRRGPMTCSGCHDPHLQTARDLAGRSAVGPLSDLQCTDCHPGYAAAEAARRHGRHQTTLRCVDCHMPLHWLTDSPESRQRVADHAIATPRPQESIDFGVPNACNECHRDRTPQWSLAALRGWGQASAQGVRPWVRAFALGRSGRPEALPLLLDLLRDPKSGPLWRASAAELLATAPPGPELIAALAPTGEDRDPVVRAHGLRALILQDEARRESWIRGALGDPDPMVRSILLELPGPLPLSDAELRSLVTGEALVLAQPPGDLLTRMARVAIGAGQPARAALLLDLALPHATPLQIELGGMRSLRQSVTP